MSYQPMLPVVDEWVLWLFCLLVPLMALVTLTAFIVYKRERKVVSKTKERSNLLKACLTGGATLAVLGFMLFSGLQMEVNQNIAFQNLHTKYDVTSVVWKNEKGKDINPTDSLTEKNILIKDNDGTDHLVAFNVDRETSEPFIEFLPVNK